MSFRTVVISKQSKLSYKNRFLVVKQESDEKYIHLSEIDTIIVDSISVSISTYLLKELSDNKINIIFCDEKHNPFGELKSYYLSHNVSKKILLQTKWSQREKNNLWQEIIKNKITNQALQIRKIKSQNYNLLLSYVNEVVSGDLKRENKLLIANLPLGTTNDVGTMYGYNGNLEEYLRSLLDGDIKNIDVCKINNRAFVYFGGIGSFVNAADQSYQDWYGNESSFKRYGSLQTHGN